MRSNDSDPTDTADPADPTVVRPTDLRSAVDAMAAASAGGHRVLLRGTGTATDWGAPVTGIDTVLDTTGLTGIEAYNPSDMTVEVGAGMPLAELRAELAAHDQRVALDAARVDRAATVGGLLATADAGPAGLVYGSLRDLVLGATVVLADGTVARTGGHVVKNVAGYDLAKLLSGSLGTLALAVRLVLRLHPRPAASGTVVVDCDPPTALTLGRTLLWSPLEPVAAEWHGGRLLARFEGTAEGVRGRLTKAVDLLAGGDGSDVADGGKATALSPEDADRAWSEHATAVSGGAGDTVVRIGTRPSAVADLIAAANSAAAPVGVSVEPVAGLGTGACTIRLTGGDADGHASVLRAVRDLVRPTGGSVTVRRRITGLDAVVPSWDPTPPATIGVWRRLKEQLDPDGRLGPGRFAPWLGGRGDEERTTHS